MFEALRGKEKKVLMQLLNSLKDFEASMNVSNEITQVLVKILSNVQSLELPKNICLKVKIGLISCQINAKWVESLTQKTPEEILTIIPELQHVRNCNDRVLSTYKHKRFQRTYYFLQNEVLALSRNIEKKN